MLVSVNLLHLERREKTNQEKRQTNKKFKASKNILESRVVPLLWVTS